MPYYKRPYYVPENLRTLKGPTQGEIHLPISVYWEPGNGCFDVANPNDARVAYRVLITNGTKDDIEKYINPDLLIALWNELLIPREAARQWESKHRDLRGNIK